MPDSTDTSIPVGIVGVGEMGSIIADRLSSAGRSLVGYDVQSSAQAAYTGGIEWVSAVVDVPMRANVILVVVATDEQVQQVVTSMLPKVTADTRIVVHSTVAPHTVHEAALTLGPSGARLVDAGMSRGDENLNNGSLTLMVGGEPAIVDQLRPIMELYATDIVHAGPLGAGMKLKICNNLVSHSNMMTLLEVTRLAEAAGIDRQVFLRAVSRSTGGSWIARHWNQDTDRVMDEGLGDAPVVERTQREIDHVNRLRTDAGAACLVSALLAQQLPDVLRRGLVAVERENAADASPTRSKRPARV